MSTKIVIVYPNKIEEIKKDRIMQVIVNGKIVWESNNLGKSISFMRLE